MEPDEKVLRVKGWRSSLFETRSGSRYSGTFIISWWDDTMLSFSCHRFFAFFRRLFCPHDKGWRFYNREADGTRLFICPRCGKIKRFRHTTLG
jgi:hypothetical protein